MVEGFPVRRKRGEEGHYIQALDMFISHVGLEGWLTQDR